MSISWKWKQWVPGSEAPGRDLRVLFHYIQVFPHFFQSWLDLLSPEFKLESAIASLLSAIYILSKEQTEPLLKAFGTALNFGTISILIHTADFEPQMSYFQNLLVYKLAVVNQGDAFKIHSTEHLPQIRFPLAAGDMKIDPHVHTHHHGLYSQELQQSQWKTHKHAMRC